MSDFIAKRTTGLVAALAMIVLPETSIGNNTLERTDAAVTVNDSSVSNLLKNADYGDSGDVILQVYLRDIFLTDALFARISNSRLYLPLGELASLLEFPIVVDAVGGNAAGWYLSPDRTINIDVSANHLQNRATRASIPPHAILKDEFDLYIDTQALEQWLPIVFDFSLTAQRLIIRSDEPLPAELARARAQRKVSTDTVFQAVRPYVIPGYRAVDWPSLALNIGSYTARTQTTPNWDYSFRALGDLAFMNGTLSGSGTNTDLKSLRLTLGRSNPSGMFGPLRVADFQFGDTSQFLPGQIGSSVSGRGFRVGNSKLSAQRDLDTIDLQGELIAGYEVELYVNERLRGVVRDTDDNLYRFEDVQLRTGQNEIRLEFYGPQGQRKTEINRTYVGPEQLSGSRFNYEFSLLQPRRLVFEDILTDNSDSERKPNQLSGALDVSYGLGRRASLGMTVASLAPADDNSEQSTKFDNLTYFNARLTTAALGSLFSYELTADDNSNLAGALRWRTRRSDYELAMTQLIYDSDYRRFNDRNQPTPELLPKRSTRASIARVYRNGLGGAYSWSADAKHYTTQGEQNTISSSIRMDYRRAYIGATWEHSYQRNLNLEDGSSSGSLGFNLRFGENGRWSYRGDLAYADTDDAIRRASLGASRSFSSSGGISLQATRDVPAEKNHYSASWTRQFKTYQFTSSVSGSSLEDIALRLGVSLALQRYPGRLLPEFNGRSNTSPRVAAQIFADENNNGKRDQHEAALQGVRLTRNGLITNAVTDENGYALLSGLSATVSADIGLISSDIDDPTLRSESLNKGILPRPGRLPIIQIPLRRTIDIEGKVTVAGQQPAPNVRMVLRPNNGGEPLTVQTEYDGVYYLAGVPLGTYDLEPDRGQLKSANLYAQPVSRKIEIKDSSTAVRTFDFVLQRNSASQVTFATRTVPIDNNKSVDKAKLDELTHKQPLLAAAHSSARQIEYKALQTHAERRLSSDSSQNVTRNLTSNRTSQQQLALPAANNTDHDLDGVPDSDDRCMNTSRGDSANRYGCVYIGAELSGVLFTKGSTVITTDSAFALNGLARELLANPSLNVAIHTHTDNTGNARRNMSLSISRARSIIHYLVDQGNISPSRLSGIAMGESDPLVRNTTASGRAINRRVVTTIRE